MKLLFFVCIFILNVSLNSKVIEWKNGWPSQIIIDPVRRISSAPYLAGDTFRAMCDCHFDPLSGKIDTDEIRDGDLIFVSAHGIDTFIKEVHPNIKVRYILLTHESDRNLPADLEIWGKGLAEEFLNSNQLAAWFCQNLTEYNHPKLFALPIGIGSDYLKYSQGCIEVKEIEEGLAKNLPKKILCLCCYNYTSNGITKRDKIRSSLDSIVLQLPWITCLQNIWHLQMVEYLTSSEFVLCPKGDGIDTFRFWETLYCGSYPIIDETAYSPFFKDLPVLVLDDFNQLSKELLEHTSREFKKRSFNMDKIYAPYWESLFSQCKIAIRNSGSCLEILSNNK